MEVPKLIFGAGIAEKGKKIAARSYNVLLLIALGMLVTLVFSIINSYSSLAGWLFGLSLVGGVFSLLFYYVIAKVYHKDLGFALIACFFLWIPTEIICVVSMIINLVKIGGTNGSMVSGEMPHALLIKGIILVAGLLILVSPVTILPKIREEWALSRRAEMMIAYDTSVCLMVVDKKEIRVEMSPKFFWTKEATSISMSTKFREEDQSKEEGRYRMERRKDQMTVFCDGKPLYEFEVPTSVDRVMLYFPPKK
ncbi:MAG: hypothetical protein J6Z22_03050 [Lachnospiraceae bacterium]|nr:hypothetical protein [Lachnospiraceae bacterium]